MLTRQVTPSTFHILSPISGQPWGLPRCTKLGGTESFEVYVNDVFQNTSRVRGGARSGNIKLPKKKKKERKISKWTRISDQCWSVGLVSSCQCVFSPRKFPLIIPFPPLRILLGECLNLYTYISLFFPRIPSHIFSVFSFSFIEIWRIYSTMSGVQHAELTYTSWNEYHNNFSESQRYSIKEIGNTCFSSWWELVGLALNNFHIDHPAKLITYILLYVTSWYLFIL